MSHDSTNTVASSERIALKDRNLAAFLAWLLPGLGHFYQGRKAKGALFSVCILTTFFYGLFLGQGRVVYASWGQEKRLHYLSQVCVGLPAMPALVQAMRVRNGKAPFGTFMAPPRRDREVDELALLHRQLNRYFELGSVFTMIAGLLNVLVIYDAWAGPAFVRGREEETPRPPGPATSSG